MTYKGYKSLVCLYKVEAFNWPMEDNGSLKDPSNLGGLSTLDQYLAWVKTKKAGFRWLTESDWTSFCDRYASTLATQENIRTTRKVRSDKGVKRREPPVINSALTQRNKNVRIKYGAHIKFIANNLNNRNAAKVGRISLQLLMSRHHAPPQRSHIHPKIFQRPTS